MIITYFLTERNQAMQRAVLVVERSRYPYPNPSGAANLSRNRTRICRLSTGPRYPV
jgi:hypothetical protein